MIGHLLLWHCSPLIGRTIHSYTLECKWSQNAHSEGFPLANAREMNSLPKFYLETTVWHFSKKEVLSFLSESAIRDTPSVAGVNRLQ